jgi:hypothetical protein
VHVPPLGPLTYAKVSKETYYKGKGGVLGSERGQQLLAMPQICARVSSGKRTLQVDLLRSKRGLHALMLGYLKPALQRHATALVLPAGACALASHALQYSCPLTE